MKEYKPYQGSEVDFQKTLAKYLDSVGLDWFHPANGELRNKVTASKLKAMGVKAGVPDIIIITPCCGFSAEEKDTVYRGMVIELKVGKNKITENQAKWLEKFSSHYWKHLITYSLDEAIETINNYYQI